MPSCWRKFTLTLSMPGTSAGMTLERASIQSELALRQLHRDRAEKVTLAEIYAAMAQDRVRCGHMEIEVRQHKMVDVVGALHVTFVGRAERKRNVVIGRPVDCLLIDRLQIGHGPRQAILQLVDCRFVVLM